jgi:hypothetical protein
MPKSLGILLAILNVAIDEATAKNTSGTTAEKSKLMKISPIGFRTKKYFGKYIPSTLPKNTPPTKYNIDEDFIINQPFIYACVYLSIKDKL